MIVQRRNKMPPLLYEEAKTILAYAPNNGPSCLIWIKAIGGRGNRIKAGASAGWESKGGYYCVTINKRRYGAHRLVWLLTTGKWPTNEIDHIDRNPSNNRIENLRECDRGQNCQNLSKRGGTATGLTGVHIERRTGRFYAAIQINKKQKRLGTFTTKEEAHDAYLKAKAFYHTFNPSSS
jgi:hypothetical protein